MVEQWPFKPLVRGSSPRRPTCPEFFHYPRLALISYEAFEPRGLSPHIGGLITVRLQT